VHDDQSLLAPDEPAAFRVEREDGRSSFFLTCDHAGALVPRKLNSLGVSTLRTCAATLPGISELQRLR